MLCFPRFFRSVLLSGCILAVAGALASAEDKPLFVEKFTDRLSAGWTWIDEVPGSWELVDEALELKVLPVGEGLWTGGRKHPNLLVREPGTTGDFAIEAQIKSQPTSQFEHAGLLLFADGDNYVVLNKEMFEKPEVVMVSEKDAKPATRQTAYAHEEICLRLAVAGKKVTGQYRHYDTDAWQTLGELDLPVPGPYKIGVLAGRPPKDADHRARFSNFRILPGSAAAAQVAVSQPMAKDQASIAPPAPPVQQKREIRTDISLAVQARQSAARAIPYIEKDGATWIKDRKCLSCHYVGYMVWSFHDANERGFDIDKAKLAEWTDWTLGHAGGQGAEGLAQALLARDRADLSEKTVKLVETLQGGLLKSQDKEGFWKPGGQLPSQKRPIGETTQVSTMLCVLGLNSIAQPDEKTVESRDRALAWLKKTPPNGQQPAVSSEWHAMRLILERKFGDASQVDSLRDKILAAQQPDGGWGWLWADKSDAFGTGLSLYALSEVGVPSSHPAIQRSWKFLIETQTDNGAWMVNGTKTSTKDAPHAFSSFWGSTWALLGLSRSLPESVIKTAEASDPATPLPAVAASAEATKP